MTLDKDKYFMRQALTLANHSVDEGGGPFGAVIVKNGTVIGSGHNRVTLDNDPTAHAEVTAIRHACKTLDDFNLSGCTLYASCEPCPMCMSAIYWARIDRVVYAAQGSDASAAGFNDTFISQEICKPYEQRSISIEHLKCDEHDECFKKWSEKDDRTDY